MSVAHKFAEPAAAVRSSPGGAFLGHGDTAVQRLQGKCRFGHGDILKRALQPLTKSAKGHSSADEILYGRPEQWAVGKSKAQP